MKVQAVVVERSLTCERCHTRQDQWGTYDAKGNFVLHHPPRFRAVSYIDYGCEMLDHALANEKDEDPKPGLRWTLEPKTPGSGPSRERR